MQKTVITEFLNYLKYEKSRSKCTIDSYAEDLFLFCSWLEESRGEDVLLLNVNSEDIRSWVESMMDKGNKVRTVKRRMAALRSFFHFCIITNKINKDPIKKIYTPKEDKPLPQFLRERELNELFEKNIDETSLKEVRTYTILLTFYSTGIRLSELTGLTNSSINFEKNEIKVLGKGGKQRIIPFGDELKEALCKYIDVRNKNVYVEGEAFFVDDKGLKIKDSKVRYDVQNALANVCTLKKKTPHVLRHTFATSMLNNGTNIRNVQELLGHSSAETTTVYAHTTFEELKRTYNKAHPREE